MAYTRVTNTKNGASAIRYAFEEPSHNPNMDRVLASSGVNLDTAFAMQQMRDTWKAHGKDDGKTVQMYRIIQSFGLDELDPNNPEDVARANAIGREFAGELYPDKQALIVTQADGEGGKLHNHVLVNSVGFVDGKSLRGNRKEWKAISEVTNEVMKRHGLNPPPVPDATRDKTTMAEYQLEQKGEYVWKSDLKRRIEQGMNNKEITTEDAFIKHMEDVHGVSVRYRGNEKDENGNKIKGISYSFKDEDGKQRKSRAWRLGSNYQSAAIAEQLEANAVLQEVEQQKQNDREQELTAKEHKESTFSFDFEAELEAMRPKKPKPSKPKRTKGTERIKQRIEARREAEKMNELHAEALQENERFDEAKRQEQLKEQRRQEEAKRKEEKQRKEAERARRERELQERQEAKERAEQVQKQREQAKERIWHGIGMRGKPQGITDEFADRYMTNEQKMKGEQIRTLSGGLREITIHDIYKRTESQIKAEQRQERHVEAVQQHVAEESGPEL